MIEMYISDLREQAKKNGDKLILELSDSDILKYYPITDDIIVAYAKRLCDEIEGKENLVKSLREIYLASKDEEYQFTFDTYDAYKAREGEIAKERKSLEEQIKELEREIAISRSTIEKWQEEIRNGKLKGFHKHDVESEFIPDEVKEINDNEVRISSILDDIQALNEENEEINRTLH